jgi:hypothetical protein
MKISILVQTEGVVGQSHHCHQQLMSRRHSDQTGLGWVDFLLVFFELLLLQSTEFALLEGLQPLQPPPDRCLFLASASEGGTWRPNLVLALENWASLQDDPSVC